MPPPTAVAPAGVPSSAGFGRDVMLLTGIRIGAVGAGFLVSIIAARALGPDQLGAAGMGLTVGTVAALIANGGLNIASIYFLGRRPEAQPHVSRVMLTLGLVSAALAALLVVALTPLAIAAFRDAPLLWATAVLGASIVAFELGGSLLLGLDRRVPYLVTQVIEGAGSLAFLVIAFLLIVPTAAAYVLSAALAYATAGLWAAGVTARAVGGPLLGFDAGLTREALALGLRGQIGNVLQFLNLRLDLLLVPVLADLRAAGIYLIAVRMSEVVTQVASATSAFLFQRVARGEPSETALTERATRITTLIVVMTGAAIALLAAPLLGAFFGSDYLAGVNALRITMAAMVPLALTRILAGDLKGRGRPGLVSVAAASALAATVGFDLLLIPPFGIEGAAVATLLAYSVGATVLIGGYARVTGAPLGRLVPRTADAVALATIGVRLVKSVVRRGP